MVCLHKIKVDYNISYYYVNSMQYSSGIQITCQFIKKHSLIQVVAFVDFLSKMKLYFSDILKTYKDTIIISLKKYGTIDLLLFIIQCCSACALHNEHNRSTPVVIYFYEVVYPCFFHIGFVPIKHNKK